MADVLKTLKKYWPTSTVNIYEPVTEVDVYGGQSSVDWTLVFTGIASVQQKSGTIGDKHSRETHDYTAVAYIAGSYSFKVGSKLVNGSDTYIVIDTSNAAGLGKLSQLALRASNV